MPKFTPVETGSQPGSGSAAIATVTFNSTNIPPDYTYTYTADGKLDTLFSDTVDLPGYRHYRGLWCTVAGNIKYNDWAGNVVGPVAVQAGQFLPIRIRRIFSTNTTVTGVIPIYDIEDL